MRFTSYAQNFEDVLLHRALGSIEHGQYLDVGAADPEFNSVTKAFYDLGWSGVNVEPVDALYSRLVDARERDTTLKAVVGAESTSVTLYSVAEFDEISTTVADTGEKYREQGRGVSESIVDSFTLSQVWDENLTGDVHFLKVDVEGAELDVLSGADFTRQRPWIILIEVVAFGVLAETADASEALLIAAGYERVYFDGLNRFYVANEKLAELKHHFEVPVNVTDDFRLPSESTAEHSLGRIAESLGIGADSAPREIMERTVSVVADRVAFETEAIATAEKLAEQEIVGTQMAEQVTQLTEQVTQLTEQASRLDHQLTHAIAERDALRVDLAEMRAALADLRAELEARRQQSFERERHIAALSADVERGKRSLFEQDRAIRASWKAQVADIYSSTSWRVTLPIRAIRRPAPYVRKLFKR